MNNICIVIPYFGKWPRYLSFFLKSCSYNSKFIDYIIFTDNDFPLGGPSNVKFYEMSMNYFNELASQKLNIDISITDPYKLCDFKPSYGTIFSEYIYNYDYWGHGDLDLILGNLSKFLKGVIAQDYHIISLRKEWVSGSFCLYRNTTEINNLFRCSKSVPSVFLNDHHYSFTECMHLWDQLIKGFDILKIDYDESMTYLIQKKSLEGELKYYHNTVIKESIDRKDFVCFNNGRVLDSKNCEYAFYHYITEKNKFKFFFPIWENVPDKFYIDSTGFYTESEWNNLLYRFIFRISRRVSGFKKFISYYLNHYIVN